MNFHVLFVGSCAVEKKKSLMIITISWFLLARPSTYHLTYVGIYMQRFMICVRKRDCFCVFVSGLTHTFTMWAVFLFIRSFVRCCITFFSSFILFSVVVVDLLSRFSVSAAYYPLMLLPNAVFSFHVLFTHRHRLRRTNWEKKNNNNTQQNYIHTESETGSAKQKRETAFPINNLASLYSVPSWISFWTVRYISYLLLELNLIIKFCVVFVECFYVRYIFFNVFLLLIWKKNVFLLSFVVFIL